MKGAIALAAGLLFAGRIMAQVVPSLGTDQPIGSVGITSPVVPALGLPLNPAAMSKRLRWSVELGSSSSRELGIAEQSVAAAARVGRLAIGGRFTTRQVKDLFEDPVLRDDDALRVGSQDYAVGLAASPLRWLSIGAALVSTQARVLGTSGSGTGWRAGATLGFGRGSLSLVHYDVDVPMQWRSEGGAVESSPRTSRVAAAVAMDVGLTAGTTSSITFELASDRGYHRDTWVRGSVAVAFVDGAINFVAGHAHSRSDVGVSYSELGVMVRAGWTSIQLGTRLGGAVIGNSFRLGLGLAAR